MSFGVCTDACLLFVRCLRSSCTQTASAHTKHLLAHAPELVVLHTIHTRSGSANTKAFGSTNIWSAAMRWSPSDGVWRCERRAFICSVRIEFIRQMSVWPRLMAGHADVGRIQKKKESVDCRHKAMALKEPKNCIRIRRIMYRVASAVRSTNNHK